MKIKTSELIGAQLDWAVAKAEALNFEPYFYKHGQYWVIKVVRDGYNPERNVYWFSPSTDWSQGGPLIEKFRPVIVYHNGPDETPMAATREQSPNFMAGDTVLIAAMRAIVAAKLGEEIEVPEELV